MLTMASKAVAEVHIAHHKPADLLKKAKLLLGMLEPRLEFFDAGHRLHYPIPRYR